MAVLFFPISEIKVASYLEEMCFINSIWGCEDNSVSKVTATQTKKIQVLVTSTT